MRAGNYFHFLLLFFRLKGVERNRRRRHQNMARFVRRIRLAVGLMVSLLAVGTAGYVAIEGYPYFDAFYMSVITLASVGFGEVHPLSTAGRVFTSFLILFNIGLFAYAISTITSLFADGGYTRLYNDFRMDRDIQALHDHTIICGFGRHATEVTAELHKQNMPFVVIDNQPSKIEQLANSTNYLYIEGDATQDAVLEEAGIHQAAALVTTLPSDADNMFVVLSARQINPAINLISRANNAADELKLKRAGANHTVVPERIGGFYMATLINKPDLVEFFTLLSNMGPSNVVFEEIQVENLRPEFKHRSLDGSLLTRRFRASIVALRHTGGQYELNPPSDSILLPGQHLVVLGNPEQMAEFKAGALTPEA